MTDSNDQTPSDERQPPLVRSTLPRITFGRSKRGDYIYYCALILASIASWVVALLPRFVVDKIALFVAWLSFTKAKDYRENVGSNLSHIFDLPADSPEIVRRVREVFRTNALNVVDLLQIPHLSRRDFDRTIKLAGGSWSTLDDAVHAGHGAIIITAHLGPFDYVASALRVHGYPLSALTARTTGRFAFHFVSFLRASQNMRVIETSSGGLRQVIRVLQQGEMIILASDRDFFLSGRETLFFDEQTTLPTGAVRLSRDTGSPIIPFFAHRSSGSYELTILEPIFVPKTANRDADMEAGLAVVSRALEIAIGRAPEQWVLFQRVWPEDHKVKSKA